MKLIYERIRPSVHGAIRDCFVRKKQGALYDQNPQSDKPALFDRMMFAIFHDASLLWPRAEGTIPCA
jgi:hypothetical protein